jgi:DNA-binding response OmpR family regulator
MLTMAKRTILVVDDDDDVRKMLVIVLAAAGYAVWEASDGLQALERARRSKPALIVADLMMPRMSGEDLVRTMTEDASLAGIPVAIVSGQTSLRTMTAAPPVIAQLTKPFELDELLNVVDQFAR